IFKRIMGQVMRYWNIAPKDKSLQPILPEEIRVPNFVNLTRDQAMDKADSEGFSLRIEGEGELIVGQIPVAGANVPFGTTIIVYTGLGSQGQGEIAVPRLEGLSLRETSELLGLFGLRLEAAGSGIALSQNPPAGARVKAGDVIQVDFGEPGNE
ncbi:MAG: PASTA domain-containing protein, partial [Eubacteriales bacterium]|nr:PASTA domain-containing protein [Eubacteriales bacterium]